MVMSTASQFGNPLQPGNFHVSSYDVFLQHNNTTPDDIGICEAYLAFLRAAGDNGAYWRVLDSHGQFMHLHPNSCR